MGDEEIKSQGSGAKELGGTSPSKSGPEKNSIKKSRNSKERESLDGKNKTKSSQNRRERQVTRNEQGGVLRTNKMDSAKIASSKDSRPTGAANIQKEELKNDREKQQEIPPKDDPQTQQETNQCNSGIQSLRNTTEHTQKQIPPDSVFKFEIPYRDVDQIPTSLFKPYSLKVPQFSGIRSYNAYIHDTTRMFSVDTACEYVFIKRVSNLE